MLVRFRSLSRCHWAKKMFVLGLILSLVLNAPFNALKASSQGHMTRTETVTQWVETGVNAYKNGDYVRAIADWEKALVHDKEDPNPDHQAIVLENLARGYQQVGQLPKALQTWQQLVQYYGTQQSWKKQGNLITELAQTHTQLGQNRRAISLLCDSGHELTTCDPSSAIAIAQAEGDHTGEAAAMGALANAYQSQGDYTQAIEWSQRGLSIARDLDSTHLQASLLNNLGTAYLSRARLSQIRDQSDQAIADQQQAVESLEDSVNLAKTDGNQASILQANLNLIPLYPEPSRSQVLQNAVTTVANLPASRDTIFSTIQLATLLETVPGASLPQAGLTCQTFEYSQPAQDLLTSAIAMAQEIGDRRAESFAMGELGHFYECAQNYSKAIAVSQQARWAAETAQSPDSLYLWEWQLGRIYTAQHQEKEAIAAYESAIEILNKIRSDILIANRDVQFDFRDTIEPLYRELAALRLASVPQKIANTQGDQSSQTINLALNTVDSLKLAELQNYFGDDCVLNALPSTAVREVGQTNDTAVFNTIVFPDQTAMILTLPNGDYRLEWLKLPEPELIEVVNTYRLGLEKFYEPFNQYSKSQAIAQKLYDLTIRPFASDLEQAKVKTLVFVQDGILRTIPMSALYDGQQFLIEKYAIASTPSLKLTNPQTLKRQRLKAMLVGLTQSSSVKDQQYPPLPFVNQEFQAIRELLPNSRQIMDDTFTRQQLEKELSARNYPIIHIATHAQFSSTPEETFLVTGNNQPLDINTFDRVIRNASSPKQAIELLMLTACQTAVGDARAALGLAGVAIQAGARSSIASLWFIRDDATAKLSEVFYENLLDSDLSKAEALQQAQLHLLNSGGEFSHPYYWSAFTLIGNWL